MIGVERNAVLFLIFQNRKGITQPEQADRFAGDKLLRFVGVALTDLFGVRTDPARLFGKERADHCLGKKPRRGDAHGPVRRKDRDADVLHTLADDDGFDAVHRDPFFAVHL